MSKLTSLILGCALLTGCKGKPEHKEPPPQTGSAQPAGDAKWIDKLPQVSAGDTQLLMQFAIGLVRIGADGSLQVANAPSAAATDPRNPGGDPMAAGKAVQLAGLGDALGLPPVKAREESLLGVVETGQGSGSGSAADQNPADVAFARLAHPVFAQGAPAPPRRVTSGFALAHPGDVSGGVIVFADAGAKASVLVDVLAQTGGFVAVRRGNQVGALPIQLDRHAPALTSPLHPWFELRLGPTLELESVPAKPTAIASIDKVADAVKAAGAKAVDVLVDDKSKVQDVVAAVDQLRAAGIEAIGLGRVAGTDGGTRGEVPARVITWDFYLSEGDKAVNDQIRAALDPGFPPMRACYMAELLKAKDLAGEGQLDITVLASGKVQGASATGLPPALIACAVNAAKALTFPGGASKISTKIAFAPR